MTLRSARSMSWAPPATATAVMLMFPCSRKPVQFTSADSSISRSIICQLPRMELFVRSVTLNVSLVLPAFVTVRLMVAFSPSITGMEYDPLDRYPKFMVTIG